MREQEVQESMFDELFKEVTMTDPGMSRCIDFPGRRYCRHARISLQNSLNTQKI